MENTIRRGLGRGRGLLALAGALVVGLAVALGLALDQGSNQVPSAQLTSVESACQQWLGTDPGLGGNGKWCSEMDNWMWEYMLSSGAGPQMMWGDADQMLVRCEQWMDSDPPSGLITNPHAWCGAMVGWMTAHMRTWSGQDTWGDWMMNGPMMGLAPDR
jgi:hypothetical protein